MKPPFRILLGLTCTFAVTAPALAVIDLDHDGLGDVWQQFYHATALSASADTDGDGMTNAAENAAGTDPFNPTSKLEVSQAAGATASQRILSWPSLKGKSYLLEGSTNLSTWAQEGIALGGTGGALSTTVSLSGSRKFYRIVCQDKDTDGDGVTDWEEITACLNPNVVQTTPGTDDFTALVSALTATDNTLTTQTVEGQAFEADSASSAPHDGLVRLVRTGGLAALNVNYTISGSAQAGVDYTGSFSGTASFPFGCNQVDLTVNPTVDPKWEVPRTVMFSLFTGTGYTVGAPASGAVTIQDFETQSETLYYAQLTREAGVTTNGSGYATLFLSGDHASVRASVSFTGLTSAQAASHGSTLNLLDDHQLLQYLISGQVFDFVWTFPETGV